MNEYVLCKLWKGHWIEAYNKVTSLKLRSQEIKIQRIGWNWTFTMLLRKSVVQCLRVETVVYKSPFPAVMITSVVILTSKSHFFHQLKISNNRTYFINNTEWLYSVVPNLFGTRDQCCGRQFFPSTRDGGWFQDNSRELHLLCTLFLLLNQLHLR